jgi:hypothetical protein
VKRKLYRELLLLELLVAVLLGVIGDLLFGDNVRVSRNELSHDDGADSASNAHSTERQEGRKRAVRNGVEQDHR